MNLLQYNFVTSEYFRACIEGALFGGIFSFYRLSDLVKIMWRDSKSHYHQPVRFLAKRFAVKEAAAKAFGTGIRNGLAFNQFEVFNNPLGKPCLRLLGQAKLLAEQLGILHHHVTLADERRYACATVIFES